MGDTQNYTHSNVVGGIIGGALALLAVLYGIDVATARELQCNGVLVRAVSRVSPIHGWEVDVELPEMYFRMFCSEGLHRELEGEGWVLLDLRYSRGGLSHWIYWPKLERRGPHLEHVLRQP